jgi:hypothetical protein
MVSCASFKLQGRVHHSYVELHVFVAMHCHEWSCNSHHFVRMRESNTLGEQQHNAASGLRAEGDELNCHQQPLAAKTRTGCLKKGI